jgi:APA family basic amino acid/polyamine antiporter
LWAATALVIGHTIGVGVFLAPAELIGALGSPPLTLAVWAGCGGIVLAGALTFGELASRYPHAGGPYLYLREGWGARVAFLYGWQSLLVMDPGITAALAAGFSQYLGLLWPAAAGRETWLAVSFIWLLAAANMLGIGFSARLMSALTAVKLAAFAGIVLAAFSFGDGTWARLAPVAGRPDGLPPLGEALALALVGAFFSFGGFWEASRAAGDVHEPSRTLPRALVLGVSCVTLVYIATTVAFLYLVPAGRATSAAEVARLAGQAIAGSAGAQVLAAVVALSVTASAMALLLMAPRMYVAMESDRLFPATLARRARGTQAPARATALLAALATLFVMVATFQQIVAFFLCTALAFIGLAAAALLRINRRAARTGPFVCPGYPLTPILFVLLIAAVVILVASARPLQAGAGFAVVLLGIPVYEVLAARNGVTEARAGADA